NLFGHKLPLCIPASLYFHNQPTQNISDRVFLATLKKASFGLKSGVVGYENLIIRASPVAYGERIGIASDHDTLELQLGATRNRACVLSSRRLGARDLSGNQRCSHTQQG